MIKWNKADRKLISISQEVYYTNKLNAMFMCLG